MVWTFCGNDAFRCQRRGRSRTGGRRRRLDISLRRSTLNNWDGNPKFWRVEDGTITGQTTAENPTKGNTFLICAAALRSDFELEADYKIIGDNSGIQYRSFEVPGNKWVVGGYQGDIDAGDTYSGILYGERLPRDRSPNRGQKTVIGADHKPKVVGASAIRPRFSRKIKKEDWNDYQITVRGFHFEQRINGVLTAVCDDEDTKMRRKDGILALQLHAGPPMKVQFRNIRLQGVEAGVRTLVDEPKHRRKIVFIAGKPSHGYAAHEHKAGCLLLAKALNENVPQVRTECRHQRLAERSRTFSTMPTASSSMPTAGRASADRASG